MSKTYRVTLPSGETVSRSSVRDYTHAIAYRAGRSAKDVREALQGRLRELDQDRDQTPAAREARAEILVRLEDLDGVDDSRTVDGAVWALAGFRSSVKLAEREARRLEKNGAFDTLIIPVELVHDDDAPAEAPSKGVAPWEVVWEEVPALPEVDEDEHIAQVGLAQGRFLPVPLEEYAENAVTYSDVPGFQEIAAQEASLLDLITAREEEAAAIEAALDLAVGAYLNGRTVSDRAWGDLRESLRPAIVAASPGLLSTGWERGYEDGTVDEIRRPMIDAGVRSATVDPYLKGAQA